VGWKLESFYAKAHLLRHIDNANPLGTFARKLFNIDFFLKILPLKVDELCQKCKKNGGHRLRLGENRPERTP